MNFTGSVFDSNIFATSGQDIDNEISRIPSNSSICLGYILQVLQKFYPVIPVVEQSGMFDTATRDAIRAFQRENGLPITGAVDAQTWDTLYERLSAVENNVFNLDVLFPDKAGTSDTTRMLQFPGQNLSPGMQDGGIST